MANLVPLTQAVLARAVGAAMQPNAGICSKAQPGAALARFVGTNPIATASRPPAARPVVSPRGTGSTGAPGRVQESAAKCNGVQQSAAPAGRDETNPFGPLTPQQVAAARLLAAGRTNRAAAAELSLNEHTIGRWRRRRDFAEELARQQRMMLAALATANATPPRSRR